MLWYHSQSHLTHAKVYKGLNKGMTAVQDNHAYMLTYLFTVVGMLELLPLPQHALAAS